MPSVAVPSLAQLAHRGRREDVQHADGGGLAEQTEEFRPDDLDLMVEVG